MDWSDSLFVVFLLFGWFFYIAIQHTTEYNENEKNTAMWYFRHSTITIQL